MSTQQESNNKPNIPEPRQELYDSMKKLMREDEELAKGIIFLLTDGQPNLSNEELILYFVDIVFDRSNPETHKALRQRFSEVANVVRLASDDEAQEGE